MPTKGTTSSEYQGQTDRRHGYLALALGSLTLVILISPLLGGAGPEAQLLTDLALVLFLVSGYALLMDELRASPEFNGRFSAFATTEKRRGTTRMVHPTLGRLRLNYEVLLLPDDVDEQRLVTWLPADEATATALARADDADLPTSPAQLRVIG